ncbi:ATP-dependent DNA helicase [Fusarium keratoplasticum]|uniref:ATP-dependent DNA helicase n=1 Tax=Fusarium keratoplasticum TaxID=1328300 RepID=A0ACC0QBW9_9HYPO|nr:ATP-dependent DNA helicase [Fusarium keratoplasticum]KAI8648244.1 ATP-dependent DNA helicase [Fusarium keratoplasticum]
MALLFTDFFIHPVSNTLRELPVLTPSVLTNLQMKLQVIRYLIIDEMSIIGLCMMSYIDERLRQIFPHDQNKFFGGRSVLLIGDFHQLPPVMQKALYSISDARSQLEVRGYTAYVQFNKAVIIRQVVRQQGNKQAAFRMALQGFRDNKPTIEQWRLLRTRLQSVLPFGEVRKFDSAIRIYPTNAQVRQYNLEHMERLRVPCIRIAAAVIGVRASEADSMMAGNLHNRLPICIGARVLLTENLWTAVGLVNGGLG